MPESGSCLSKENQPSHESGNIPDFFSTMVMGIRKFDKYKCYPWKILHGKLFAELCIFDLASNVIS